MFRFVARQQRVSPAGVVGLDISACLEVLEAYGLDRRVAALLLPYAEAGLLRAIRPVEE